MFDDGAPDTRQVPVDALARAYRIGADAGARAAIGLGYGDPRGTLELRERRFDDAQPRSRPHDQPDNICLTRGSQMAIYLAARILVGRGYGRRSRS